MQKVQSLVALKGQVNLRRMKVNGLSAFTGTVKIKNKSVPVKYNQRYAFWQEYDVNESALELMARSEVI